jgi:hypothetical protein
MLEFLLGAYLILAIAALFAFIATLVAIAINEWRDR